MNKKPRYTKETTRYFLINFLHAAIVITPRCYPLFDNSSIPNVMVKLKKEGVLEKSKNEEVFANFKLGNYRKNLEDYFDDVIPEENLIYFSEHGALDTKKAKFENKERTSRSRRIIRNAETIAMMYASSIKALPDEKTGIVKDKTLTDNVYYQAREIKYYAGYKDTLEETDSGKAVIASRINGTLLTAGGNYNIYHIGKDLSTWSAQGEYKIRNYIQNMLALYINQKSCELDSAILYTYDLRVFQKILHPTGRMKARYEGLSMTYTNIYVLPFDKNGREMTKLMSSFDWERRVKEYMLDAPLKDTSKLEFVCDYYDGKVYTFVFCVPNLSRYLDFVRKVVLVHQKEMFSVICFDYQAPFVAATIGNYAEIYVADFLDTCKELEVGK